MIEILQSAAFLRQAIKHVRNYTTTQKLNIRPKKAIERLVNRGRGAGHAYKYDIDLCSDTLALLGATLAVGLAAWFELWARRFVEGGSVTSMSPRLKS